MNDFCGFNNLMVQWSLGARNAWIFNVYIFLLISFNKLFNLPAIMQEINTDLLFIFKKILVQSTLFSLSPFFFQLNR